MKKLVLLFFVILHSSIQTFTQWSQIAAINSSELNAIKFYNTYTGITDDRGVIWRSTNFTNLEISISSSKSEYIQLEPVWLTFKIKNNGNSLDSIAYLNDITLLADLIIKNSADEKLKYHYIITSYIFQVFEKIKSNEEKIFVIDINNGFGNEMINKPIGGAMISYFSVGKYYITSTISVRNDLIYSNQIEISVKQPDNTESELFDKLIFLYQKNGIKIPNYGNKADGFNNFYNQYFQSVYAEQAFYLYTKLVKLHNYNINNDFINDCLNFFQKHPNSNYSYDIVQNCSEAFVKINGKDKEKLLDFWDKIMLENPDSIVKYSIERLRNNNEYLKIIL